MTPASLNLHNCIHPATPRVPAIAPLRLSGHVKDFWVWRHIWVRLVGFQHPGFVRGSQDRTKWSTETSMVAALCSTVLPRSRSRLADYKPAWHLSQSQGSRHCTLPTLDRMLYWRRRRNDENRSNRKGLNYYLLVVKK